MRVLATDFGRLVLGNVCRPLLAPNCQACNPASENKKRFHPRFAERLWLLRSCPSFLANFVRFFREASNEDREDDEDEGEDGEGAKATLGTNEPTQASVKSKSRFF
jgi:hypothetical protein